MNAIHFVDSNSSFSSSALVFNKNIKTLYSSYELHNYKKLNLYKNTVNVKIYNFGLAQQIFLGILSKDQI